MNDHIPIVQTQRKGEAIRTEALNNYRIDAAAAERLEILKSFLVEVSTIFGSADIPARRWFLAIMKSEFVVVGDDTVGGARLLRDLHECARAVYCDDLAAMATEAATFRYIVEQELEIEIPTAIQLCDENGIFKLPNHINEVINPFERSVRDLEMLLRVVLEHHCAGNVYDLTLTLLECTTYRFQSGLEQKGETVLHALCAAKYRCDANDSSLSLKEILKIQNYQPVTVLRDFKRSVLIDLYGRSEVTVVQIEASLANLTTLDMTELQALAVQAVRAIALQPGIQDADQDVGLREIRDREGNSCSLLRVLMQVSQALWIEKNPDRAVQSIAHIITQKGYTVKDSLRFLQKQALAAVAKRDISEFSDQEVEGVVRQRGLSQILDTMIDLASDPSIMVDTIRLLRPQEQSDLRLEELVPRYVGLKIGKGAEGVGRSLGVGGNGIDNAFIAALMKLAASGEDLNLSRDDTLTAQEIAIRGHRKSFEREPSKLIEDLREHIERFDSGDYPHLTSQQRQTLKAVLTAVRQHFVDVLGEDLSFMRSAPFMYQREGVRFLRKRNLALLADEAGLAKTYQIVAAAIAREDRVLYVTPAATVHNVQKEILNRSKLEIKDVSVITSDSKVGRTRAIQGLKDPKFVIVGYETLSVLKKSYKDDFHRLQQGIQLVIMDEAHTPENARTDRGDAVRALSIPNKWFATATPYRNGVRGLFWMLNSLDPEGFPDERMFAQVFCETLSGLQQLHRRLRPLMLRRTKEETVEYFDSPESAPFSTQLSSGQPRVPRQRLLAPEEKGAFALSPEQEQTILWMISDFRSWAADYNERYAPHGEEINLATINPLLKFQKIHEAIYEPEHVGLRPPDVMYQAVDHVVDQAVKAGRKIILWVARYATADFLGTRYQNLGTLVLDGRTKPEDRVRLIDEFQNNPNVRILVGNELALGTGVTITAAQEALLVQPSWTPTRFIQTLGRHQRVIGLENVRFAKEYADTAVLIPFFSDNFLRSIDDPELSEILGRGTLPAQTYQRLRGGLLLFRVVADGYQDEQDFFRDFQRSLLSSMGLVEGRSYDLTAGIKPSQKAMVEVAKALATVWKISRGDREIQDALFQLVAQARFHKEGVMKVAQVIAERAITDARALRFISAIFEIKNKSVRDAILELTPRVLERLQGHSLELDDGEIDVDDGAANILRILPLVLSGCDGADTEGLREIIDESVHLGSSPRDRATRRALLFGLVPLISNEKALKTLLDSAALSKEEVSLQDQARAIYQLGKMCQIEGMVPDALTQKSFGTFAAFAEACERSVRDTLEQKLSIRSGAISEVLAQDPVWSNNVDHILGFVAGWITIESIEKRAKVMAQAAEVFGAVFEGRLREFRASNSPANGRAVRYRADDTKFWDGVASNEVLDFQSVELNQQILSRTIADTYRVLKREIYATGIEVEGKETGALVQGVLRSESIDIEYLREGFVKRQKKLLAVKEIIDSGQEPTSEQIEFLERLKLSPQSTDHEWYKTRVDGERALEWLRIEEIVRGLGDRIDAKAVSELEGLLKKKQVVYESEGRPQISYSLELAAQQLRASLGVDRKAIHAQIQETDHPAFISRMGCLSPAMVNCFNPDSEPVFTQWVLGAMASKNFKLLVAREKGGSGRILAAAACKVRRVIEANGDMPALFLERGLSELPYNFRREMLELLARKATELSKVTGQPVAVAHQIFGRVRASDVRIGGTGAYTADEYAEAVFHLRNASAVVHMARLYSPEAFGADRDDRILEGMGVGRKNLVGVVNGLRRLGARLVIDIRTSGNTRLQEQCRKVDLENSCRNLGIEYQDWGERLGNPKGGSGVSAYPAYREFMTSDEFKTELAALKGVVESCDGMVVIVGSHPKQRNCTRGLLIHALSQALWDAEGDTITAAPSEFEY
jgi:hypothetical protein